MYEVIEEFLEAIVDMKWAGKSSKLAIVGGIMINCDGHNTDRFVPLKFDLVHKNGARDDLFMSTFGFAPHKSKSLKNTAGHN